MPPRAALDAYLPPLRISSELESRLLGELETEAAARPAENFTRADLVRSLLLEALEARRRRREDARALVAASEVG